MARMRKSAAFFAAVVALAIAAGASCGKTSPGPGTGPSPVEPPQPPPVTVKRLTDGSGNPGPLAIEVLHLQGGPGQVSVEAVLKMDSIPNHGNSPWLAEMKFVLVGSQDGLNPQGQVHPRSSIQGGTVEEFIVKNGGEFRVNRRMDSPVPPRFFIIDPGSKFVMFVAAFGPLMGGWHYNLNPDPCPTLEVIANWPWPRPPGFQHCVLRIAFEF